MPSIEITEHSDIDQAFKVLDQYATKAIKGRKPCFVNFGTEKSMSKEQRGALHVWLGQVAKTLNEAGLPCVQKSLFGGDDIEIDWTMHMVKELQYKRILLAMRGKTSTEQQSTIEPSQVAQTMIRHYGDRGVVLPPWPSRRG